MFIQDAWDASDSDSEKKSAGTAQVVEKKKKPLKVCHYHSIVMTPNVQTCV